MFFKEFIIGLYTTEDSVVTLAAAAMTAFSLALLPDSILFAQLGVFRGLARQNIVALL
jgi:Na+-driven multidrug efflux pump